MKIAKMFQAVPATHVHWVRRGILWSALLGLFVASYLLYVYTSGAEITCGPLHGCDVVRASSWSSWFGIPTPAFGVAFYLGVIALIVLRAYHPVFRPRDSYRIQLLLGAAGFVESFFLTMIQRFALHTFCTWCLVSAACATVVFFLATQDRPVEESRHDVLLELKAIFISFVVFVIAGGSSFWYLTRPRPAVLQTPVLEQGSADRLIVPDGTKASNGWVDDLLKRDAPVR